MIAQALAPIDADLPSRKETLDVSKIFLTYLATFGDVVKTADVAECKIADVLYLAKVERWDTKLSECSIARAENPTKAKELTREVNRTGNYVQALRLRAIIDKTLQWIYENENNVGQFCQEVNKQGRTLFSTKPVLDLTKAAEAVHAMTYRALGDTVAKEDEGGTGPLADLRSLHLTVINHMQKTGQIPEEEIKRAEKASQSNAAVEEIGFLDVNSALENDDPGISPAATS